MSDGSIKFSGFEDDSPFMRWVKESVYASYKDEILEDIGKEGVAESQRFIRDNKVTPPTTDETLDARRKGKNKAKSDRRGITLLDTGTGIKQIAYEVDGDSVLVGVPDGYMAYHQEGRQPKTHERKKREFLKLPDDGVIEEIIKEHMEGTANGHG